MLQSLFQLIIRRLDFDLGRRPLKSIFLARISYTTPCETIFETDIHYPLPDMCIIKREIECISDLFVLSSTFIY